MWTSQFVLLRSPHTLNKWTLFFNASILLFTYLLKKKDMSLQILSPHHLFANNKIIKIRINKTFECWKINYPMSFCITVFKLYRNEPFMYFPLVNTFTGYKSVLENFCVRGGGGLRKVLKLYVNINICFIYYYKN